MCNYYYRITVNDALSAPVKEYPSAARWSEIAEHCEERGWTAKIERRLIVERGAADFLAGLTDASGYVRIADRVFCPWEILAEMKPRTAIVIPATRGQE